MRKRGEVWFFLALGAAMALGTTAAVVIYRGSRGIRNNNPGNIKKGSDKWKGAVDSLNGKSDATFVQFSSPEYGIRAFARILRSYKKAGAVTLDQIITKWAPPSENNTKAYKAAVIKRTGFAAKRVISEADYPALIAAMIRQENTTQPYPLELIKRGVSMA